MGFWDNAKKAVNGFNEHVQKEVGEFKKLESYSDEKLLDILNDDGFFGSSKKEKRLAKAILNKRGYSI